MLQRKGTLEKLPTAQPATQNKVPFQQRAGVLEMLKNLFPRHATIQTAKGANGKPIPRLLSRPPRLRLPLMDGRSRKGFTFNRGFALQNRPEQLP